MIRVTPALAIDDEELHLTFVRASGPGGQNVNKVSTAAHLRFDAANSETLPEEIKTKLIAIAGTRATKDGVIVIHADRFRTQERNRDDAVARLIALIAQAAHKPKPRKTTRPTAASRERRLDSKARRGRIKAERGGKVEYD
ncbi:MAG: aminoacyl-tRNA hydrolase [Alphaproteobacteria bacterium]|nr:aminoacyl-tRNA hydrolase [Alphaproteobacteria bacterium]